MIASEFIDGGVAHGCSADHFDFRAGEESKVGETGDDAIVTTFELDDGGDLTFFYLGESAFGRLLLLLWWAAEARAGRRRLGTRTIIPKVRVA